MSAETIWKTLKGYGWSDGTVAGIMGNMQAESGLIADRDEIGGGGGYGLVQWTPKSKLVNWAEANGLDWKTEAAQCARIKWEAENGQQFYKQGTTFDEWCHASHRPEEAADDFVRYYERPAVVNSATRQEYARSIYNSHAGTGGTPTFYDASHVTGTRDTVQMQKQLGVTMDGIAGPDTIRALCRKAGYDDSVLSGQQSYLMYAYFPTCTSYWPGSTGSPTVKWLQGKIGVSADGHWGPDTADGLEHFFDNGGTL